jgi:3-dehydroquinate dehydratase/shikimate dehydrogenase
LQEVFSSDLTGADCAEVRLDYLDSPQESVHARWDRLRLPVIATCRGKGYGGRFEGSIEEEMRILRCAVQNGAQFVDIDYRSAKFFGGAQVIASFHDFSGTPAGIDGVVDYACAEPGGVAKVATFVNSWADNRRLLSLLPRQWPKPLIIVGMGEIGQITRVIGPSRGSFLTYAASTNASAPGQLSVREMLDVYGFRRMKPSTKVVGILGSAAGDSMLPDVYNRAFAMLELDFVCLRFSAPDLKDFLQNAPAIGVVGFCVATSHETAVIPLLDGLTAKAREAGAIDTVSLQDGKWIGDAALDMVYNPPITRLLRSAARQFEIWTGHRAPLEIFEEKSGLS